MKRFLIAAGGVIVAGALLTGCGNESKAPEKAIKAPLPEHPLIAPCEPGIPGGKLVIATFGDPKTFNPITENESSSYDIIRFLFGSLLNFDWVKQQPTPGMAESWSVAPDKKTWTFKLRKGLRWSDGQPLTADDVVFTWNDVIYNPKINNVTRDLFVVNGKEFKVSKVDDLTIKVVTPEIYAPFLENFGSGVPILPKHALAKLVQEGQFSSTYGINTDPSQIVGSGPYILKEYKPAQYTLMARNPYFWEVDKKGQRLPYFDNIIYTVVPDMNAMSLQFLNGQSDVDESVRPEEYDRFKAEAGKGKFKLLNLGIGLENFFFWFNENTGTNKDTGKPYVDPIKLKWFRNATFRKACAYAIDRDSIINSIYAGRAQPSYSFISPANKKWNNPDTPKTPYNPDKARELLKQIGIEDRNGDGILEDADGHPIEFVLNTNTGNDVRDKTAVLIQSDLQQLGFKVIFQPIEFNSLVDKINNTYDYECILLGFANGTTDPGSWMNVLKSDGFTHDWFPREKQPSTPWEAQLDKLMDAQMTTLDYAERKKDFDQVQMILTEKMPMIYTVIPESYAAVRSDIGNLRPTPLSYYRATWNVEELYFKK